MVIPNKTWVRL